MESSAAAEEVREAAPEAPEAGAQRRPGSSSTASGPLSPLTAQPLSPSAPPPMNFTQPSRTSSTVSPLSPQRGPTASGSLESKDKNAEVERLQSTDLSAANTTRRRRRDGGATSRTSRQRKGPAEAGGPVSRVLGFTVGVWKWMLELLDPVLEVFRMLPSPWKFSNTELEEQFQQDHKITSLQRADFVTVAVVAILAVPTLVLILLSAFGVFGTTAKLTTWAAKLASLRIARDVDDFARNDDADLTLFLIYGVILRLSYALHMSAIIFLSRMPWTSTGADTVLCTHWFTKLATFLASSGNCLNGVNFTALTLVDALLSCQVISTLEEQLLGMVLTFAGFIIYHSQEGIASDELKLAGLSMLVTFLFGVLHHSTQRSRFLQRIATNTLEKNFAANQPQLNSELSTNDSTITYFSKVQLSDMTPALEIEFGKLTAKQAQRPPKAAMKYFVCHSKVLGRGGNGIVYRAQDQRSGQLLACKSFRVGDRHSAHKASSLKRELGILQVLEHPHVVAFRGSMVDDGCLKVFLEYCSVGSLDEVLQVGPFSEELARQCCAQILCGLHYLHMIGICHADMKPSNILILEGMLKLSDFGSADWLHTDVTLHRTGGTKNFRAPEMVSRKLLSRKGDIWGLGLITSMMLCCRNPSSSYPWRTPGDPKGSDETKNEASRSNDSLEWADKVRMDNDHRHWLPKDLEVSDFARVFLERCLEADPGIRSNSYELQEHEFVKGQYCTTILAPRLFAHARSLGLQNKQGSFQARWSWAKIVQDVDGTFDNEEMEARYGKYFRATIVSRVIVPVKCIFVFSTMFSLLQLCGLFASEDSLGLTVYGVEIMRIIKPILCLVGSWLWDKFPYILAPRTAAEQRFTSRFHLIFHIALCLVQDTHIVDFLTISTFQFASVAFTGSTSMQWLEYTIYHFTGFLMISWDLGNKLSKGDADKENMGYQFMNIIWIRSVVFVLHMLFAHFFFHTLRQSFIRNYYGGQPDRTPKGSVMG